MSLLRFLGTTKEELQDLDDSEKLEKFKDKIEERNEVSKTKKTFGLTKPFCWGSLVGIVIFQLTKSK